MSFLEQHMAHGPMMGNFDFSEPEIVFEEEIESEVSIHNDNSPNSAPSP